MRGSGTPASTARPSVRQLTPGLRGFHPPGLAYAVVSTDTRCYATLGIDAPTRDLAGGGGPAGAVRTAGEARPRREPSSPGRMQQHRDARAREHALRW